MSTVTAVPIRPIAKGSVAKLWIALVVLAAIATALAWWGTAGQQVTTTRTGLRYQIVAEGTGAPVTSDDIVQLTYVGRRPDGTIFDSTDMHGGQPMATGVTGIIPGLAEGLLMMKENGSYRLWIPPHLGYGPNVPPGAPFGPHDTLQFDIHVVRIVRGVARLQQMMGQPQGGAPGDEVQENMRELESEHANPHAGAPETTPPPPSGNGL
jgi:FKBP-type peptidyl-prolyl cis-trans isomerase FkpA